MMPAHTAADGMTTMMLLSLHASDYLRALLAKDCANTTTATQAFRDLAAVLFSYYTQ